MNAQPTELVTKAEALGTITRFIERPGVMDLPAYIELLTWQAKLTIWLLQERKEREQHDATKFNQ
jgi:hypothetical protein